MRGLSRIMGMNGYMYLCTVYLMLLGFVHIAVMQSSRLQYMNLAILNVVSK
jgi:hypothetical protein